VVSVAESLYVRYAATFGWEPDRINLVLLDAYDISNGMATPIFENTIYLFLQPPVGSPYFGTTDGWVEELLRHELVHIFHLDKPHSLWGSLPLPELSRYVFGRNPFMCAFPNLLDPGWQVEGIATYYESEGGVGRLNNRYFTDQMLAYARKGRITPDLMTLPTDGWPYGRWYLWGSLYLEHLARRYGEREVVRRVVDESFFEDPITTCSCGCIPGPYILREMRDFGSWRAEVLRESSRKGRWRGRRLTFTGNSKGHIALSPSGRLLAYTESTPYDYPSLKVLDLREGKVIRRVRAITVGPVSWSGDTLVLFSQYNFFRNFHIFSDIYSLNVRTGKVKRLTRGERAHSPLMTPEGLLYVRREGATQSLVLNGKVLLKGDMWEGFTDLKFHRDTVFMTLYRSGWHNVAYLPLGADSVRMLTLTRHPTLLSHVDDGGAYFTDDFVPMVAEGGSVRTLHSPPFPMLYPIPYGDSILALVMDSEGLDVWILPKEERDVVLPTDFPSETAGKTERVSLEDSRPYSPLPHLLPKFWQPLGGVYAIGDTLVVSTGLLTAGSDVLMRHMYLLTQSGGVGIFGQDTTLLGNLLLLYRNESLFPTWGFSAAARTEMSAGERRISYALEFSPYVLLTINHMDGFEGLGLTANLHREDGRSLYAVGVRAEMSRMYAYKRTATLPSEGFYVSGEVLHAGGLGGRFYGALALKGGWLLLNARLSAAALPYPVILSQDVYPSWSIIADTFIVATVFLYPNIFHPSFRDLNVSILPPSPWAFVSYLSLTRLYPGVAIEYLRFNGSSPFGSPSLMLTLNADVLLLSTLPLRVVLGYNVYPVRGIRLRLGQ